MTMYLMLCRLLMLSRFYFYFYPGCTLLNPCCARWYLGCVCLIGLYCIRLYCRQSCFCCSQNVDGPPKKYDPGNFVSTSIVLSCLQLIHNFNSPFPSLTYNLVSTVSNLQSCIYRLQPTILYLLSPTYNLVSTGPYHNCLQP